MGVEKSPNKLFAFQIEMKGYLVNLSENRLRSLKRRYAVLKNSELKFYRTQKHLLRDESPVMVLKLRDIKNVSKVFSKAGGNGFEVSSCWVLNLTTNVPHFSFSLNQKVIDSKQKRIKSRMNGTPLFRNNSKISQSPISRTVPNPSNPKFLDGLRRLRTGIRSDILPKSQMTNCCTSKNLTRKSPIHIRICGVLGYVRRPNPLRTSTRPHPRMNRTKSERLAARLMDPRRLRRFTADAAIRITPFALKLSTPIPNISSFAAVKTRIDGSII